MDSPRNRFDESDLTPEELRAKRRADFDGWLQLPEVPLCYAVMLSLGIIPQFHYRLRKPRPLNHAPFYPEEPYFGSMQRLDEFHFRMGRAITALRVGHLKGEPDLESARESDYRVSLGAFERWANKTGFSLPEEWGARTQPLANGKLKPQVRRQQNNLLRIIRALMRVEKLSDGDHLWRVVERAPLAVPLDRTCVERALLVLPLEVKHQEEMTADERQMIVQTPSVDELIGIIAALASSNKTIDLSLRGTAAKRIDRWVIEDQAALNRQGEVEPALGTIRIILQKVRRALVKAS